MKNVTISMDDELAHQARVAAARAGKSVSKYLAEAAREKIKADELAEQGRNRQLEALERILAMPSWASNAASSGCPMSASRPFSTR
jgi:plasmid stability protein